MHLLPEPRGTWWPGLAALATLAVGTVAGLGDWMVDQWREWVLAAEAGLVAPAMDVSSRLPAGTWLFELVLRPLDLPPAPLRAVPVYAAIAMVLWIAGRRWGGRAASLGIAAAVLLPPFLLFAAAAVASAFGLALAAWAWVRLDQSRGRAGWPMAAGAAALYPAAAPVLVASVGWRMARMPREPGHLAGRALAAMAATAVALRIAYAASGVGALDYAARFEPTRFVAALRHAGGGPWWPLVAILVLGLAARRGRRGTVVALFVAWLVAALGIAARFAPWTVLQPVFVVSGVVAVAAARLAPWSAFRLALAAALAVALAAYFGGPDRQLNPAGGPTRIAADTLPARAQSPRLTWRAFAPLNAAVADGAEPWGAYGLLVRWAAEYERREAVTGTTLAVAHDPSPPWCAAPTCVVHPRPVTAVAGGAAWVQLRIPVHLQQPLVLRAVSCDGRRSIEPRWSDVRVVYLWNYLGVIGTTDLPAGCWRIAADVAAGDWQALQRDADGVLVRARGELGTLLPLRRF